MLRYCSSTSKVYVEPEAYAISIPNQRLGIASLSASPSSWKSRTMKVRTAFSIELVTPIG